MITGTVNASREAEISLRPTGTSGQTQDVNGVIDTGYRHGDAVRLQTYHRSRRWWFSNNKAAWNFVKFITVCLLNR